MYRANKRCQNCEAAMESVTTVIGNVNVVIIAPDSVPPAGTRICSAALIEPSGNKDCAHVLGPVKRLGHREHQQCRHHRERGNQPEIRAPEDSRPDGVVRRLAGVAAVSYPTHEKRAFTHLSLFNFTSI